MDQRNLESRNRKLTGILFLLPTLFLYALLIFGGLALAFMESLGYIPALSMDGMSLDAYRWALGTSRFFHRLVFSLLLAGGAASASIFAGVVVAFWLTMAKSRMARALGQAMAAVGVILPYLYVVLLVMLTFSKTGLLSRLLYSLHIIRDSNAFPRLVHDSWGIGPFLVFCGKGIPFVVLFVYRVMGRLCPEFGDIAISLGGKRRRLAASIYAPLCQSSIIWSGSILFAYFLGSYEVPYLVGSTKQSTISVMIYSQYISPHIGDIPKTMALSLLLFLAGGVGVLLYALLLHRILVGRRKKW